MTQASPGDPSEGHERPGRTHRRVAIRGVQRYREHRKIRVVKARKVVSGLPNATLNDLFRLPSAHLVSPLSQPSAPLQLHLDIRSLLHPQVSSMSYSGYKSLKFVLLFKYQIYDLNVVYMLTVIGTHDGLVHPNIGSVIGRLFCRMVSTQSLTLASAHV